MRRLDFSASPAILTFWHQEMDDPADDFMTDEEIESAFVGWWAVVLHSVWLQVDWALLARLRRRGLSVVPRVTRD